MPIKDITLISNSCGTDNFGPGVLFNAGKVKRIYTSYFGGNRVVEKMYLNGKVEAVFLP